MAITRFAEVDLDRRPARRAPAPSTTCRPARSAAMPVTWASRTEDAQRQDQPRGADRRRARVVLLDGVLVAPRQERHAGDDARRSRPTVTFDKTDAGWKIARSDLTVRGEVPGIDQAKFAELADDAKDNCPVSQALKGNVVLSVAATLA